MEQAQALAHVLLQASRQIAEAMPAAARLQGHLALHRRGQPPGERRRPHRPRGDRVALRRRHRPDGRDPLEGHLRASRGGDRRHRAASPTSSRASSSRTPERRRHGQRHRPRHRRRRPRSASTSPTASTTRPTWWPRRSPRGRSSPRLAVRLRVDPQLRRRVHLAEGRGDGGQGHREPGRHHADRRVRRPDRRDRLEPDHLVLRPAVELVARAHRRPRRRGASWPTGPDAIFGAGLLGKVDGPGADRPDPRVRRRGGPRSSLLYRIVGRLRPGPREPRASGSAQLVSGGLLALAHGTNDAQKTMGVITLALVANGNIAANNFHVPDWVVVSSATRDRPRHLHRRLADHQDDGQPDHQDGPGPGLLGPGRRRGGRSWPPRTSATRCPPRT